MEAEMREYNTRLIIKVTLILSLVLITSNSHPQEIMGESLEDGSNYKVKISCTSEPSVYGESKKFDITSGYKFVMKWGKQARGKYKLNYPSGIAIDSIGNVYVADTYNHRIMKFTSEGNLIKKMGKIWIWKL